MFAARGVDNVSLRELAAAAGQRNHSVAAYHFGDKRELLEALLERHSAPISTVYQKAAHALASEGRETLQTLTELIVRPLVNKLDDDDGGAEYVLICAELVNSQTFPLTGMRAANSASAELLRERIVAHMQHVSPGILTLRLLRTANVLFGSLAAYQRLRVAGLYVPREEFAQDLVATMVAMFSASSSLR